MSRLRTAWEQITFLRQDLARLGDQGIWKRLTGWVTRPAITVFCYRHSRFWLLLLGPTLWRLGKLLTFPFTFLIRPWMSGCEIHPEAAIGPGLWIVHTSLGAVVAREATIGAHCTMTGGNVVGIRRKLKRDQLTIGDHAMFGVNAVVLGPVKLGNGVRIGAGAVVTRDAPDGAVLAGVPAALIQGSKNGASTPPVNLAQLVELPD